VQRRQDRCYDLFGVGIVVTAVIFRNNFLAIYIATQALVVQPADMVFLDDN
jgi:hypothetical protein